MNRLNRSGIWLIVMVVFATVATFSNDVLAQRLVGRSCGKCGMPVGLAAQVGEKCPHCNAYWGYQRDRYVTDYGCGASFAGEPWGYSARSEMHERHIAALREMEAERAKMREYRRDQSRLETEQFRLHNDPLKRVQQHLACARQCEAEGDVRAANAYRRLAARVTERAHQTMAATTPPERLVRTP
jgi:type II secretory ATPase GspE/PulE/Tfp pilus assembly ATPase PilB-like protein